MKIIAHRGNLRGPDPDRENTIGAAEQCIDRGFDVEVDVWCIDDQLWLGHDGGRRMLLPTSYIDSRRDKLWLHAKNIKAVYCLADHGWHWFWHERDTLTLTSKGIIWCHYAFIDGGITMLHTADEVFSLKPTIGGICTDFPELAASQNAHLWTHNHT